MIVLHLRARDVNALLSQGYDTIRVYKDSTPGGLFNTLIGTVPLVNGQELYDFVDGSGALTDYYEFSYFRSIDLVESNKSVAFNPSPAAGPLSVLTIDFVRNTTDIPAVANLDASKVNELIVRTETELVNYANRFGGLNIAAQNYSVMMPIIGRLLLEEIFLRSRPTARTRAANGLASERIGSYSYTTRATDTRDAGYWTAEIINLLEPYLIGLRLESSITTTQVFPEIKAYEGPLAHQQPGVEVKTWHDFLDRDFGVPLSNNVWANLSWSLNSPAGPVIIGAGWDI